MDVASQPPTNDVESAFRPAFEEISRRAAAARTQKSDDTSSSYFDSDANGAHLPFHLPGQAYVLVSIGSAVLAPRPVDATRPALRVYGAFAQRDECVEHADVIRNLDPACSLIAAKTHEWILVPQTELVRDDPEAARRCLQARLDAHEAERRKENEEFDRVVKERTFGKVHATEPVPEDQDEQEEAEALVYQPPRRLRAGGEVRGQTAFALCVIPDEFKGECLVKVLGCFETSRDADDWVRNVASRHILDHDVVVAPTCEWVYPNGKAQTQTHYRNHELQRIMDAAERNPKAVRDYKQWKREQDRLKEEEDRAKAQLEDAAVVDGEGEHDSVAVLPNEDTSGGPASE